MMICGRLLFAFLASIALASSHSDCELGIYTKEGNRWEEYRQRAEEAKRAKDLRGTRAKRAEGGDGQGPQEPRTARAEDHKD